MLTTPTKQSEQQQQQHGQGQGFGPFGDDGKPRYIMPDSPLSKYQQTHPVPIKAYDASYYTSRTTFAATHPIPSLTSHSSSMPQLRDMSLTNTQYLYRDEYTPVQRAVAASQMSRKFDKKKLPEGESTTSMQLAEVFSIV